MRLPFRTKYLFACLFVVVLLMVYLDVHSLNSECDCRTCQNDNQKKNKGEVEDLLWSSHTLCVIVPYRERFEELMEFAPHLHSFLNKQKVRHHIMIMQQVDQHRFNRASLINVGFIESRGKCDYISMHDVDLLPLNPQLSYKYPEDRPFHLAAPHLHPRYHYKTFVGGILLMKREHFEKVNGLSNRYWGWGLEDDEFFLRLKSAGLTPFRPGNLTTGVKNTFLHLHDRSKRKRDSVKLFNQKEVTRKRDRRTGLNNVDYHLLKKHNLVIEGAPLVIYDVQLTCDYNVTPWCDSSSQAKINKSTTSNKASH